MENVVYILGAGFSAPLGLPTMANFLTRSKDIYVEDPKRYSHFKGVFDLIDTMAKSKTYYSTDLTNIEEILSILEMQEQITNASERRAYVQYIVDVIQHFDPPMCEHNLEFPSNWYQTLFKAQPVKGEFYSYYGYFVGSLLNLRLHETRNEYTRFFSCEKSSSTLMSYSVITLNYDLVIERFAEYFRTFSYFRNQGNSGQIQTPNNAVDLPIAKLHGSVDKDSIVPPTWNKFHSDTLVGDWDKAYAWLMNANHIRIIGYSLPVADSYVKYLLKAAVLGTFNLKSIDVICTDSTGDVERRYSEFVEYNNFRFVNNNVTNYLFENHFLLEKKFDERQRRTADNTIELDLDQLEDAHNMFMKESQH